MSARVDGAASCRTIVVTQHCPAGMRKRDVWRVDQFHLLRKVGSGYASTVYLGTCRSTGNQVAVKLYHKNKLSELNHFQVAREITIHSGLDHKHIIQLWAAFEDQYGIYLVFEYASKGDVFTEVERRGGQLNEAESVRQVIYPFLSALDYLHSNYIIHRDIKPENLLFTATGVLKVGDFGLSINFSQERPVTRVGTLDYMAPEVVVCPDKHRPHDHKELKHLHYTPLVDAWAVGVLAYELIVGRPPFDKGQKKATIHEILNGEPFIPPWLSEGAVHFIKWALTKDHAKRPSVRQLAEHPWIAGYLRQPAALVTARRQLVKTDSFVEPRQLGFRGSNAVPAEQSAGGGGGGGGGGAMEPPRPLQVASVAQGGRQLGHSNSMSAVDGMRYRDVQLDGVTNGMATAAEQALAAVKRVSDGDGTTGGRPSAAGGRVSRAGTARNSGAGGGIPVSRIGSLNAAAAAAALAAVAAEDAAAAAAAAAPPKASGRPMTREELLASLSAPLGGRSLHMMRSFTAGRPNPMVVQSSSGAPPGAMRNSSGGGGGGAAATATHGAGGGSVTAHGMLMRAHPPTPSSPLARTVSSSAHDFAASMMHSNMQQYGHGYPHAPGPPPQAFGGACPSADLALELSRVRVDVNAAAASSTSTSASSAAALTGSMSVGAPYSPKPGTPLRPQPPQAPSPSARGLKSGSPLIPSRLSQSFSSSISPLAAAAAAAAAAGGGSGAVHPPSRLAQQSNSGYAHLEPAISAVALIRSPDSPAAATDPAGRKTSGAGATGFTSAPVPSVSPPASASASASALPSASASSTPNGRAVSGSSGDCAVAGGGGHCSPSPSPSPAQPPSPAPALVPPALSFRELSGDREEPVEESSSGGSAVAEHKSPSRGSRGLFGSFKRVFS